ncbi:MAG: 50S ribosomal protein L18e [Candidatus Pacearchaeota archaeon]
MKKTRIEKKLRRKTNPNLVETIIKSKKSKNWQKISHLISMPKRKMIVANLDEIDKQSIDGDFLVVPGKVLGVGELNKRVKISAYSFSSSAKEKLNNAKIEVLTIQEAIQKNPEAKNIKIIVKKWKE